MPFPTSCTSLSVCLFRILELSKVKSFLDTLQRKRNGEELKSNNLIYKTLFSPSELPQTESYPGKGQHRGLVVKVVRGIHEHRVVGGVWRQLLSANQGIRPQQDVWGIRKGVERWQFRHQTDHVRVNVWWRLNVQRGLKGGREKK